jgi:hypothetical protein
MATHPWSLQGGGAADLMAVIEGSSTGQLDQLQEELGFGGITGEDSVFTGPKHYFKSRKYSYKSVRVFIEGDSVRDWQVDSSYVAFFPYNKLGDAASIPEFKQ